MRAELRLATHAVLMVMLVACGSSIDRTVEALATITNDRGSSTQSVRQDTLLIDTSQAPGPTPYTVRLASYPLPGEMVAFSLSSAQKRIEAVPKRRDYRESDPEVFALGGINRINGLVYDRENKDVILVGRYDPAGPALTLDDLAVALRARFIHGAWPSVSIDPTQDTKKTNKQDVRLGGGIEDTQFGADLLDADYRMKLIGMGLLDAGVDGVTSIFDMSVTASKEAAMRGNEPSRQSVNARFWFYPIQPSVAVRQNVVSVKGLTVGVFTEVLSASIDDRPVEDLTNFRASEHDRFKGQLTAHFEELAAIHLTFFRMWGLDELVALSSAIDVMEAPPDLGFWLTDYTVKAVKLPSTIGVETNSADFKVSTTGSTKSGYYEISGGAQLMAIALRLRSGDVSALSDAVLITRPSTSALSWRFIVAQWIIPTSPGQVESQDLGQLFAHALFLQEQGSGDAAIALYDELIALQPNWAEHYINRGAAHYSAGRTEQAIANYTHALEVEPRASMAYNNRGVAYENIGRIKDAIADYNQALKINPFYYEVYNNRGGAYAASGYTERAIADFTKAIEIEPSWPEAFANRAPAHFDKGMRGRAFDDFAKAIELDPLNPINYDNRGQVHYFMGNNEEAIADFTRSLQLDPRFFNAYENRSVVYKRIGRIREACIDLEHANKLGISKNYVKMKRLGHC